MLNLASWRLTITHFFYPHFCYIIRRKGVAMALKKIGRIYRLRRRVP